MIAGDRLVLLDTNILVYLTRWDEVGQSINSSFELLSRSERPLLSYVTVAEVLSLSRKFGWGEEKTSFVYRMERKLVTVPIEDERILDEYVRIDRFSESVGETMGKNDIWIAATAAATEAVLLTTDSDFDHLDGGFVSRFLVDAETGDVLDEPE